MHCCTSFWTALSLDDPRASRSPSRISSPTCGQTCNPRCNISSFLTIWKKTQLQQLQDLSSIRFRISWTLGMWVQILLDASLLLPSNASISLLLSWCSQQLDSVSQNVRSINENDEWDRIGMEAVVIYIQVLPRHFSRWHGEHHEQPQSG